MTARTEIAELLDSFLPHTGDFRVSELAEKFIRRLEETAPLIYSQFKDEVALNEMREFIRHHLAQQRAAQRTAVLNQATVERLALGVNTFDISFVVDENNTRKVLAEMTGEDHRYVAEQYEKRGQKNLKEAAFHRDIATLVGNKITSEAITIDQYENTYRTIVGA